jgi:hypothetical protein
MDRTEHPLEPRHLGVPSSASKMISKPLVRSVQTLHLSCTDINIVSKQTKTRFHMTHVTYEFYRVHPKLFIRSVHTVRLSCIKIRLSLNGPNRAPPDPRHLGVPLGASKTIYEPTFDANRAPILRRR